MQKKYPEGRPLTRREFLRFSSLSAVGFLVGCATNPVTGQSQLMLVSREAEIQMDRQNAPHQISSDYGRLQDRRLSRYIKTVGDSLAVHTHRPDMPYAFYGVNAVYVNAYAFPGGTIAATRGILLKLRNEAELASLLGHELGHVNARHTAEQMSKGILTQAIVGGLTALASTRSQALGDIAAQLGMLGAGMLLASYSRENEREADDLGMQYMVAAGYGADGFVGLMEMLNNLSHRKADAVEILFSTHPMSYERYRTAMEMADGAYRHTKNRPLGRERYMDHTAGLRKISGAIELMQAGEKYMAGKEYHNAMDSFDAALKQAPDDYAALLLAAKCRLALKQYDAAGRLAAKAARVYPQEAQAHHLIGFSKLRSNRFEEAFASFTRYEQLLPGNPNTTFFRGYAQERMQHIEAAADFYYQYLQAVKQGDKAQHAFSRLKKWGYIK